MIDRTEFELRIAAHAMTTEQINRQEWQWQRRAPHPIRIAFASLLFIFAARLDPGHLPTLRAARGATATATA
jgi:hypothetical protein